MAGTNGTFRSFFGAIAVPILDKGDGTISNVTHDWSNSMAGLGGGLGVTVLRLQIRNYRVDIAKERLAEMAIKNGCQWMLFVDDDTILPQNALMKMIKLWKSDPKYKVISGVYWSKSDPSFPLIFKGNLEGSYWDWKTTDLIEADAAGAGCLFIDLDMLKKMPKPWFSCDYYFEDPRGQLDVDKWTLSDRIGEELLKGKNADKHVVEDLQRLLGEVGEKIDQAKSGALPLEMFSDKERDAATTEDLYFFQKVKEVGEKLWVDCSIQCQHQDKKTGRTWGIQPDMPQSKPRYEGKMKRGDKVVIDLGAGEAQYHIQEGTPIRVDMDPASNPDVLADARFLPFKDEFADMTYASHLLEHFSFRETINVLNEWVRVTKVDGKLVIVVPNLKWASNNILHNTQNQADAERSMFMYHSAQKGNLKEAHDDFHKAGFTPESLMGVLSRIKGLGDIEVKTTEGNFGNWEEHENKEGMGYNIIAFATKKRHVFPVSLQLPILEQEAAQLTVKPVVKKEKKDVVSKVSTKKPKKAVKKTRKTTKRVR